MWIDVICWPTAEAELDGNCSAWQKSKTVAQLWAAEKNRGEKLFFGIDTYLIFDCIAKDKQLSKLEN